MSKLIISGNPLPNMPWEERPEGQRTPLWRCSKNPIIPRDLLPTSNSIFNSAVVPFGEGFAGVFRCDDTSVSRRLWSREEMLNYASAPCFLIRAVK